ncbi:MAG: ABC transporter ATP-binding protein [Acidobacteriota bacterium]|jgi:ABC-2 type transport system ATP-binding protein
MSIQIRSLTKDYGATRALRGIDLEIETGGVVGLLGPNGAGKTTLVEILEGLRQPTSGSVSVLGLDPTRDGLALKQRIGAQLQATQIPVDLTVYEILRLYASFYEDSLPVEEVLPRVDLEAKAQALTGSLSGGQKQRLAIGMALINDPDLLIFDEPTSGLDPAARRKLHRIILDLRDRGRTVLLTTHYIEEAEKLCQRVIVVNAGRVVADGTPLDLVGRSAGKSTIYLDVDGEFDPTPLLGNGAEHQGRRGDRHMFVTSDPATFIVGLGEVLRNQRVVLTDLHMRRPTLEDVYLELVDDPELADAGVDEPADEPQQTESA